MKVIFATLLGVAFGQSNSCQFTGGVDDAYTLNLTSIYGFHLEYKDTANGQAYYYTPCTNDEKCYQANAEFTANTVQYTIGSNTCGNWLSIDRHELPTYYFETASWAFHYTDGETCTSTGQPREVTVFMTCDENLEEGAYLYNVEEFATCQYAFNVRTPLACVPEDRRNSKCQWTVSANGTTFNLDLSSEKGNILNGVESGNGYRLYYSPCQNVLPCYQQSADIKMMSIVENDVTETCDHYLAEWQDGRVQPTVTYFGRKNMYYEFHYFLTEKCVDGSVGEETIRWICDSDARTSKVLNTTYDGDCRWTMNIASDLACNSFYEDDEALATTMKLDKLYRK